MDLKAEIDTMAEDYPMLDEGSKSHYLSRLKRMRDFYDGKLQEAPALQAKLFKGFIRALNYAMDCIREHDNLTTNIAVIKKESDK